MIKSQVTFFLLVLFLFATTAIAQEDDNQKNEIEKLLNQASSDFNNAKYDKALEYSKQALITSFAINDASLIAQSYNTIGVIYNECSDTAKAIEFYEKALFYAKKANKDKLYNWVYSNLGSVSVKGGQNVKTGQVIGKATANLDGNGSIDLYINDAKGNDIDPEKWLKR